MARGNNGRQESVVPPPLPVVSVVKVDTSNIPNGVHENQMKAYGFNDLTQYQRPDHYVRYIEPLDMDLVRQVEYDMDEQDEEWLTAINAERKQQQINTVSHEVFEIIIDRLEKEYFDVSKYIPKPELEMPSEDSPCAICDDSEGENTNAIVFCDGCNLAVHQECYGIPYIPEGQWLCRKCKLSPSHPVDCVLCPNEGGAFKQTSSGEWVHLLCILWTPGCAIDNHGTMEPCHITGVDAKRWKLKCIICGLSGKEHGSCIQCRRTSCSSAYHVTCARKWKLLLPMKGFLQIEMESYCPVHLTEPHKDAHQQAREELVVMESSQVTNSKVVNSKAARAYAKTYTSSPPIVPWIIADRITQYIGRINIRRKQDFVLAACKYWSLKREHRRGAPLLKRLHTEPWSMNSANSESKNMQKIKLAVLNEMRDDLNNVRQVAELVRKRESRKLKQTIVIQNVLSSAILAHEPVLRSVFDRISGMDKLHNYFQNPVSKLQVPDYFDIVKKPMCWKFIQEKLERHEYWHVQTFKDDIRLVCENAQLYNKPGTALHRTAERIQVQLDTHFQLLDNLLVTHTENVSAQATKSVAPDDHDGTNAWDPKPNPIGDFEPWIDLLKMLYSSEPVQPGVDYLIEKDPITSLFDFELGRYKPSPLESPFPSQQQKHRPPKSKSKKKEKVPVPTPEPDLQRETSSSGHRKRGHSSTDTDDINMHWQGQAPLPNLSGMSDQRDEFKFFDAGWVLPEGSKRNRSSMSGPSSSKAPLPPPASKRPKKPKKQSTSVLRDSASEMHEVSSAVPDTPVNEMDVENDGITSCGPSSLVLEDGKSMLEGSLLPRSSPRLILSSKGSRYPAPSIQMSKTGVLEDSGHRFGSVDRQSEPVVEDVSKAGDERETLVPDDIVVSPELQNNSGMEDVEMGGPDEPADPGPIVDRSAGQSRAPSLVPPPPSEKILSWSAAGISLSPSISESSKLSKAFLSLMEHEATPNPLLTTAVAPMDNASTMPKVAVPKDLIPTETAMEVDGDASSRPEQPPAPSAAEIAPDTADSARQDVEMAATLAEASSVEDDVTVTVLGEHTVAAEPSVEPATDQAIIADGSLAPGDVAPSPRQSTEQAVIVPESNGVVEGDSMDIPGSKEGSNDTMGNADAFGEEDDEGEQDDAPLTLAQVQHLNPGKNVIEASPGKFIIEEIVTPASRKKKALSKAPKKIEENLSELGMYPADHKFESGDLVWAKVGHFPWYPAIIHDEDEAPAHIQALQRKNLKQGKGNNSIVKFLDEGATWGFIPLKLLRPLFEIPELDDDLLAEQSKRQPKKNWNVKGPSNEHAKVNKAWERAMKEKEGPEDIEDANVGAAAEPGVADADGDQVPIVPAKAKGRKVKKGTVDAVDGDAQTSDAPKPAPKKRGRKFSTDKVAAKAAADGQEETAMDVDQPEAECGTSAEAPAPKRGNKRKARVSATNDEGEPEVDGDAASTGRKKRKTKAKAN